MATGSRPNQLGKSNVFNTWSRQHDNYMWKIEIGFLPHIENKFRLSFSFHVITTQITSDRDSTHLATNSAKVQTSWIPCNSVLTLICKTHGGLCPHNVLFASRNATCIWGSFAYAAHSLSSHNFLWKLDWFIQTAPRTHGNALFTGLLYRWNGASKPSKAGMPAVGPYTSWTMQKLPESCPSKFLWRLPDVGITD